MPSLLSEIVRRLIWWLIEIGIAILIAALIIVAVAAWVRVLH